MNAAAALRVNLDRSMNSAGKLGVACSAIKSALHSIRRGDNAWAETVLLAALEDADDWFPAFMEHYSPIPPALSEAEMAQLIAEDEAADRRQDAWERAKEIAERNGEAN